MNMRIKVGTGAPDYDIDPGTYRMTLVGLRETTISSEFGQNQPMFQWEFEIPLDDGSVLPVNGITSQFTGPKSNTQKWLNALVGKVEPGMEFEPADLIGKQALGKVELNNNGWLTVKDLLPLEKTPARRTPGNGAEPAIEQAAASNAVPAKAPAPRQTVRAAAGAADDESDLPF